MEIKDNYIDELLNLVIKSNNNNEIPVGSLIIYKDKIIGKGYNNRQSIFNVCGHAEINAIIEAEKYMKDWRLNDCILISTLYPCDMCQKVIEEARISKVYYIIDGKNINNQKYNKIYFPGNKKIERIICIFNDFFIKLR